MRGQKFAKYSVHSNWYRQLFGLLGVLSARSAVYPDDMHMGYSLSTNDGGQSELSSHLDLNVCTTTSESLAPRCKLLNLNPFVDPKSQCPNAVEGGELQLHLGWSSQTKRPQ